MGGRGTFAKGNNVDFVYKTIGEIAGVKVLVGIGGEHSLPEESHTSRAYIKLKPDGRFHEMRFYDKNHYLMYEIAYHPEPNIGLKNIPVLHYHRYDKNFGRTTARRLPSKIIKVLSKYFKGITI